MATAAVTYTFAPLTLIESAKGNTNFQDLVTFLNNQVIHADASKVFTAVPTGPAVDPVSDNQFTRKKYVDAPFLRATATTAALSAGALQSVTPNGGGNWAISVNRGSWTLNNTGFLLPENGSYLAGFTLFFNGLSVTPNLSAQMLQNAIAFCVDSGNWTGSQPTSFLSASGFFKGTSGQQVALQLTLESGTATNAAAVMWAYKIPGST